MCAHKSFLSFAIETVALHNLGPAVVVVSCVTNEEEKMKPHPHQLVGKDCKGIASPSLCCKPNSLSQIHLLIEGKYDQVRELVRVI